MESFPDIVILKILRQLSIREQIRARRISHRFDNVVLAEFRLDLDLDECQLVPMEAERKRNVRIDLSELLPAEIMIYCDPLDGHVCDRFCRFDGVDYDAFVAADSVASNPTLNFGKVVRMVLDGGLGSQTLRRLRIASVNNVLKLQTFQSITRNCNEGLVQLDLPYYLSSRFNPALGFVECGSFTCFPAKLLWKLPNLQILHAQLVGTREEIMRKGSVARQIRGMSEISSFRVCKGALEHLTAGGRCQVRAIRELIFCQRFLRSELDTMFELAHFVHYFTNLQGIVFYQYHDKIYEKRITAEFLASISLPASLHRIEFPAMNFHYNLDDIRQALAQAEADGN